MKCNLICKTTIHILGYILNNGCKYYSKTSLYFFHYESYDLSNKKISNIIISFMSNLICVSSNHMQKAFEEALFTSYNMK